MDTVKPQTCTHTYKFAQHEMCFCGKLNIDFTCFSAVFPGSVEYERCECCVLWIEEGDTEMKWNN